MTDELSPAPATPIADHISPPSDDDLLVTVQALRQDLVEAGYVRRNEAEELASTDGTVWVGTSFIHGEVRVYMWRRPRGYGEPIDRCFYMIDHSTTDEQLTLLSDFLCKWAKGKPKSTARRYQWPLSTSTPAYP